MSNNYDYIFSASIWHLMAALPLTKLGGPNGTCNIAITTRGSRCKIPRICTVEGEKITESLRKRYNASRDKEVFCYNNNLIIFDEFEDKEVELKHVALCINRKEEFERLLNHERKRLNSKNKMEKWVVAHKCHMGSCDNHCINPDHLFLATNSVNQKQRRCSSTGKYICSACGYAPCAHNCECAKLNNPAALDGKVPSCIKGIPKAGKVPFLKAKIKRLEITANLLRLKIRKLKKVIRVK